MMPMLSNEMPHSEAHSRTTWIACRPSAMARGAMSRKGAGRPPRMASADIPMLRIKARNNITDLRKSPSVGPVSTRRYLSTNAAMPCSLSHLATSVPLILPRPNRPDIHDLEVVSRLRAARLQWQFFGQPFDVGYRSSATRAILLFVLLHRVIITY